MDDTSRPLPEAIQAHPEQFVFLENPVVDSLVTTVLELTAQVWTLKRRALVTEKVLEAKGLTSHDEIELFHPAPEDEAAWKVERDEFISTVFAAFARNIPVEPAPERTPA